MNSTEKIREIVQRVVKATEEWQFDSLMKQFKFLRNYVDGNFDVYGKNWYDQGYEHLIANLLDNYESKEPQYICYRFKYAFSIELCRNNHNVFETYKLLYILKILDDKRILYKNQYDDTNIKFVELLLKKADYENDSCLFEAAKRIKCINRWHRFFLH